MTSILRLNKTYKTGSLIVEGTAAGDVTVERYMNNTDWEDGWHFLSAPVSAQAISTNFVTEPVAGYDFYCWYELTNEWINFKNQSTTEPYWPTANIINNGIEGELTANFKVGKGYMAAYDAEDTISFSGPLNMADVSITGLDITGSTATYRSWHLLGNPYSSGLIWDESWTKNEIGGTINIWNEDGKSYTSIAAAATGIIPATNGFMVQSLADGASLTIPKSKQTHGGTFYKSAGIPIIKLRAHNLDKPSFHESQILFNPESTTAYESAYDCDFLAGYAPKFYSHCDGRNLCVNSLPECNENLKIPFTFIKNEGQNFSIQMYEVEGMSMDVWLLDKKNENRQNLTQNPTYVFTSNDDDGADRFEIQFATVGVEELSNSVNNIQLWVSNKSIHILNPDQEKGIVSLLNVAGQLLGEFELNGNSSQEFGMLQASGIYIITIQTQKAILSRKVFVK